MKIISLGLGVQSTAMYLMSSMGEIERADAAIFADPGAEHPKTYEMLEWLVAWRFFNKGIPVYVEKKNLLRDTMRGTNSLGKKFVTIPAFSESGGMVQRQCTGEYKIWTVKDKVRELQGLKPRQRMKPCEMWLGITMDEASRMKESQMYNITYKYPLIDLRLRRSDCISFFKKNDYPIPMKSSCIFCPYHSDKFWKDLKSEGNGVWDLAVEVDEAIRDASKRGLNDKLFLHRTCLPLDQVQFADQQSLWEEECEGYCGL
jgi:hypothetical protein